MKDWLKKAQEKAQEVTGAVTESVSKATTEVKEKFESKEFFMTYPVQVAEYQTQMDESLTDLCNEYSDVDVACTTVVGDQVFVTVKVEK
jgi:hypothetical protein